MRQRAGWDLSRLKAKGLKVHQASAKLRYAPASQASCLHPPVLSAAGGLGPKHQISGWPAHVLLMQAGDLQQRCGCGMPVSSALAALGQGVGRHAGRAVVLQGEGLLQRMKSLQERKGFPHPFCTFLIIFTPPTEVIEYLV